MKTRENDSRYVAVAWALTYVVVLVLYGLTAYAVMVRWLTSWALLGVVIAGSLVAYQTVVTWIKYRESR